MKTGNEMKRNEMKEMKQAIVENKKSDRPRGIAVPAQAFPRLIPRCYGRSCTWHWHGHFSCRCRAHTKSPPYMMQATFAGTLASSSQPRSQTAATCSLKSLEIQRLGTESRVATAVTWKIALPYLLVLPGPAPLAPAATPATDLKLEYTDKEGGAAVP